MVRLIVITLSHPTAFGIVSLNVAEAVLIFPLGVVYVLHTFGEMVLVDFERIVKLIVITLSQPAAFGIVSLNVSVAVFTLPLGEV
jgi:hypothetical protein